MNMLNKILSTAAILAAASTASASVTLEIAGFNTGGDPRGNTLGNNAGVATAGMNWGIVVDTTGNGFLGDNSYGTGAFTSDQFMTSGGSNTDDFFVFGGTTTNLAAGAEAAISNLTLDLGSNGIDTGDSFAIVWFDTNNVNYGQMTDASFTLPNDGFTEPYLDGMTGGTPAASLTLVPEPSTYAAIFGAVALGFAVVRRRIKK